MEPKKEETPSKRTLTRMPKEDLDTLGYKRKTYILSVTSCVALEVEAAKEQKHEADVIEGLIKAHLISRS